VGFWQIGTDVLARSRFVLSPLSETVACLSALGGQHATSAPQREWLAAHRAAFDARYAGDPFVRPFLRTAIRPGWIADFLVTPPHTPGETFSTELARLRRTPDATARAHLGLDGAVPDVLRADGLAERAADLVEWVWSHLVRPGWPRLRRVFEADIVSRNARLSTGGWAAVLDGMRPGMRWLGDGRLQINTYDYAPMDISDASLLFIPTTAARGWVGWEEPPTSYSIIYPCTGWLATPTGAAPPDALARLLGPLRATVLTLLATPLSTTQLVAVTGAGLGSVGGHLRVLLDAGLVTRRRSGRSVLYYQTPTGATVAATDAGNG
jgi:DNA-binding transcriptional ArsR family regulator